MLQDKLRSGAPLSLTDVELMEAVQRDHARNPALASLNLHQRDDQQVFLHEVELFAIYPSAPLGSDEEEWPSVASRLGEGRSRLAAIHPNSEWDDADLRMLGIHDEAVGPSSLGSMPGLWSRPPAVSFDSDDSDLSLGDSVKGGNLDEYLGRLSDLTVSKHMQWSRC